MKWTMSDVRILTQEIREFADEYGIHVGVDQRNTRETGDVTYVFFSSRTGEGLMATTNFNKIDSVVGALDAFKDYVSSHMVVFEDTGTTYLYSDNNLFITLDNRPKAARAMDIKKVIFNDPATIVLWKDGTKTVVKCDEREGYDPEKGLAMAISRKALGNTYEYYNTFKHWLKKYDGPEYNPPKQCIVNVAMPKIDIDWDKFNENLAKGCGIPKEAL